jgi:phage tail sheath protein FI
MPEYLAPGVYVEEVELGPKPIEGVSTSTTGFVGAAVRGPVNKPTLVTSMGEYNRIFGGYLAESYGDKRWLPYSVEGFFQNGGLRAYVVRVANLPAKAEDTDPGQYAQVAYTILPNRSQARRYLASKAAEGATELDLSYWNGLSVGTGLRVGDGPQAQYVVITGFANGRVQITGAELNEHPAGAGVMPVSGTATTLAAPTPNAAGATNLMVELREQLTPNAHYVVGTADEGEMVRVAANGGQPGAGVVALADPLAESHAVDATVRTFVVPADATGTLTGAHAAGAEALALTLTPDALATLAEGAYLQVQNNGNAPVTQTEVVRIAGPVGDGTAVPISPPLRFGHASGREVRLVAVGNPVTRLLPPRQITVADPAGIAKGNILLVGAAGSAEFVEVADNPDGGTVPLLGPVSKEYPAGTTVREMQTPSSTTALSAGAAGGDSTIYVQESGSLPAGAVVEFFDGDRTEYAVVASFGVAGRTTLTRPLRYPHPVGTLVRELSPTIRVVAGPSRPDPVKFPEPGTWGNDVRVSVATATVLRTVTGNSETPAGSHAMTLRTVNGIEPGTLLRLPGNRYAVVRLVEGSRVFFDRPLEAAVPAEGQVETCEFRMAFRYESTEEVFGPLSIDDRHSQYFATVINRASKLVHVLDYPPSRAVTGDELPLPTQGWYLGGGGDGMSGTGPAQYVGKDSDDADKRTGLYALNNVPTISIVAVPGQTDPVVQGALIAHAERARYRFAVLDSQKGADLDAVQEQRSMFDSKYAALYYPWTQIYDPLRNGPVFAPPSGQVAGIYARTDNEVGVHKAPANAVVRQVTDLEATVTKGMQDILNPNGINAIRAFPGRGIRVWGARTISSDPSWRYVNVRRLFIFLEHSIDLSTQYAVFESNDRPLWNRLKASLTSFLTTVWRSGALQGATAAEAFFVRVGLGETMTQDDIDAGRVIVLIGVAPVKPAEFVIFRIGQKVGGSEVAE